VIDIRLLLRVIEFIHQIANMTSNAQVTPRTAQLLMKTGDNLRDKSRQLIEEALKAAAVPANLNQSQGSFESMNLR